MNGTADESAAAELGADDSRWRLEFLLQSMADPSLLVPAAQAWADDGSLSRWLSRPQELLLAELGRACRVYPELADGLHQPQPCALELGAEGAYQFLSVAAPALDEAGLRGPAALLVGPAPSARRSPRPRTPRLTAWWRRRASSAGNS